MVDVEMMVNGHELVARDVVHRPRRTLGLRNAVAPPAAARAAGELLGDPDPQARHEGLEHLLHGLCVEDGGDVGRRALALVGAEVAEEQAAVEDESREAALEALLLEALRDAAHALGAELVENLDQEHEAEGARAKVADPGARVPILRVEAVVRAGEVAGEDDHLDDELGVQRIHLLQHGEQLVAHTAVEVLVDLADLRAADAAR
jgi:hypothetical protein